MEFLLTDVSFWCSIAGIAVSILAIIVIFLTRNNILDILDKDIILFDKNFELKKNAINEAMDIADEVVNIGKQITLSQDFSARANKAYNSLMCIATSSQIVDEFYSIAIDKNEQVDEMRLVKFKLACRKDIGLKTKKSKALKRTQNNDGIGANETMLRTNIATNSNIGGSASAFASQPKMTETPRPSQPIRPSQPVRPSMPSQQPTARPTISTATRPVSRPTDGNPNT